jgi:hypothetical protein
MREARNYLLPRSKGMIQIKPDKADTMPFAPQSGEILAALPVRARILFQPAKSLTCLLLTILAKNLVLYTSLDCGPLRSLQRSAIERTGAPNQSSPLNSGTSGLGR